MTPGELAHLHRLLGYLHGAWATSAAHAAPAPDRDAARRFAAEARSYARHGWTIVEAAESLDVLDHWDARMLLDLGRTR